MKTTIKGFLNVFDRDKRESWALPLTVQFHFFALLFAEHLILEPFPISLALMSTGCGFSIFKTLLDFTTTQKITTLVFHS